MAVKVIVLETTRQPYPWSTLGFLGLQLLGAHSGPRGTSAARWGPHSATGSLRHWASASVAGGFMFWPTGAFGSLSELNSIWHLRSCGFEQVSEGKQGSASRRVLGSAVLFDAAAAAQRHS